MKKIIFLIKLRREGKLKLAEPSDNVKESYIGKSRSSLKSAKILFSSGQIEDAVPMAYYSMYNMLTALLYKIGIRCENHSGAIMILSELFGIDGSSIKFAKTERVDKQYYVDYKTSEEQTANLIELAEDFNSMVYDFIDRVTSEKISEYRKELEDSLKI